MKTIRITILLTIVFLLFIFNFKSTAQINEPYEIPRINGKVNLDGLSNEPAWNGIKPIILTQHSPNFDKEPSEKTEVLIAYDNEYLYVAGRLYDKEPQNILVNSKLRDSPDPSNDWWGITIDSYNDKSNGLSFFTTPTGLRWDAAVSNDGQGSNPLNVDWNTYWDAAAILTDDGWFAEFRIPFSSLRFQNINGKVVMGIITWRKISRKNETEIFPPITNDWGFYSIFKVSMAKEISFEGIIPQKSIYILPYVLGGSGFSYSLNNLGSNYNIINASQYHAGLDAKYGITNNLTLDLTINPDFAQVEADDQQINLTRYSLFFPEKRQFFQERSSIFDFKFEQSLDNRLFYSRKIGTFNGELVQIYGGARLAGRTGPWDIGLLNMQTAPIDTLTSQNYGLLRVKRQIFNENSYLGGIITNVQGYNGYFNKSYGIDGDIKLIDDNFFQFKWAQTFENGKENKVLSLNPARLYINLQNRSIKGITGGWSFSRSGKDYNPAMGFEMANDYYRTSAGFSYGFFPDSGSALYYISPYLNSNILINNSDGVTQSFIYYGGSEFQTKSGWYTNFQIEQHYENLPRILYLSNNIFVPTGKYKSFNIYGSVNTPSGGPLSLYFAYTAGSFYDGNRLTLEFDPAWHVSSSIDLSGAYQYNRLSFPSRSQELIANILRMKIVFMLNTKFSVSSFIQLNTQDKEIIDNFRLRFNPSEGTDFYLVYNDVINTSRYNLVPVSPFFNSRAILLKFTYSFGI